MDTRETISFFHKVKVGGRGRGWCSFVFEQVFRGQKGEPVFDEECTVAQNRAALALPLKKKILHSY